MTLSQGSKAMKGMLRLDRLCGALLSASVLTGCATAQGPEPGAQAAFAPAPCEVGIYGSKQAFVVITRRGDNARYTFSDGRFGAIEEGAQVECGQGVVRVDNSVTLERRALNTSDTRFDAGGFELAGQLLESIDAGPDTPLVVLAHGSEELGWIEAVSYPYQLAGRGISVFVYDKRGTGRSQGTYSQNFPDLASDLAAASAEAKRLAEGRFGRFGLMGFSQGGWIIPLAAERADAEFIGIGYGLLVDILEEDASQVELELRSAGYGEEVIAKAKRITDITARLAVSRYRDGLEDLDAVRDQYGQEPWFSLIKGGFTGVLLSIPSETLREEGVPMFDRLNIDWSIKPMDVLREVDVPQLWILAQEDREAPIATTISRLQALREEGKSIRLFVFPDTDHGMREYDQAQDGTRTMTRITDRYYDLLADWAKGGVEPPYAESTEK